MRRFVRLGVGVIVLGWFGGAAASADPTLPPIPTTPVPAAAPAAPAKPLPATPPAPATPAPAATATATDDVKAPAAPADPAKPPAAAAPVSVTPTPPAPSPAAVVLAPTSGCSGDHGAMDCALAGKDCDATHWEFFGGASLYLLKPYFESNTAYSTTSGIGTTHPSRTETDFNWDFDAAPAVFLGIVSPSGLGVRAGWFHFDESSTPQHTGLTPGLATSSFIDPAPGVTGLPGAVFASPGALLSAGAGKDVLDFSSSLKVHSLDLEAMQDWHFGCFSLLVSGGGRYLEVSQEYSANLRNSAVFPGVGSASELQHLDFAQRFQGGGPTLAAEGRWQVRNSGLSLFANARASLLVGTAHQSNNLVVMVNDPAGVVGGSAAVASSADSHPERVLPVTEIELGFEYRRCVGRAEPFFRAAVVDKTYFDAGNASRQDGNLSLFGAQFTFGVKY